MRSLVRTGSALAILAALAAASCGPSRDGGGGAEPVTITSIEPAFGPRTGGFVVRIEGSGFGATPFVTLGASNVETFVLVTDDAIELIAPADNVGPASLTVVNADGGRATLVDAFFYAPLAPVAYERRFFADSPDEDGANLVVVDSAGQLVGQLDVAVPRADAGAIAGRLTDAGGAPLAGHDVLATSAADGATVATLTGVDGRYRLDGLFAGAWTVRTSEEADSDYADQAWPGVTRAIDAEPVEVVAGSAVEGIDLALEAGGSVAGVVRGGTTPLAGAVVYAYPVLPDSLQFAYAVTGAAGAYEIRGLAPGEYRLVASAFGSGRVSEYWPGALEQDDAIPIAVEAESAEAADFELDEGASLGGEVVEDSPTPGPLPGTLVIAHELTRGLQFGTATAADGTWRLGELPPGDYRVEVPEIGQWFAGVTGTAGATVLTLAPGEESLAVSFVGRLGEEPCADPDGTGTIAGTVTGPNGNPLFRVQVAVASTAGAPVFTLTGVDGGWAADCLVPGAYSVLVLPANTDLLAEEIAAGVSVGTGTVAGIDGALIRGAVLAGTVRDAETFEPLGAAPVRVRHTGTGASRIVLTGPDGRWQADRTSTGGLPSGTYRIEAMRHIRSEHVP